MPSGKSNPLGTVLNELQKLGLLLASDRWLPSVAGLVAGEPVRGSWWAHPRAHEIFRVMTQLSEHPDALVTKLISNKVTFVHRQLWPALLGVACAQAPWQLKSLPATARSLFKIIAREGQVQTHQLPVVFRSRTKQMSLAARELEEKLLVYSEEIHSSSGAHAKRLESWPHWSSRVHFRVKPLPPAEGGKLLEERVEQMNTKFQAAGRLPWS